jgi:hypothetical protein
MGIVLAALQLGLDLDKAKIDLADGKIVLSGTNGIGRTIPVDKDGYFYVDWRLTDNDPHLLRAPIEALLWQDEQRLQGQTNGLSDTFRNRLVVVGSAAQGNNRWKRTPCWSANIGTLPIPLSPIVSFAARRFRRNCS